MEYTLEAVLNATKNREPNFENLAKVLKSEKPGRPTLFEFFLNDPLEEKLSGVGGKSEEEVYRRKILAYRAAGYDYVTVHASNFGFKTDRDRHGKKSVSINEGGGISDRESFEKYPWESPKEAYQGRLELIEKHLPEGMRFVVFGPGGVLENVIALVGYETLCYMIADDPELVEAIFEEVGKRLVEYYETIIGYDCVGAMISNDDWGFNTQTMLSAADMRKYVFPQHKKIAQVAKKAGKPVALHSCGNLAEVWTDFIDDIGYDAKHSYEDVIQPVEQAYDMLKGRIAVLGGIDVDFVCRAPKDDVFKRARALLEKTGCEGYALGTGNSIPAYVPDERYFAMILAALV
jgi:uroporphyrinogen decarboxylase